MAAGGTRRGNTPKGEAARQRIVAEAARIFARDGYRAGTLAAIAEAAGLTQQGLLHYFRTKDELLLAVIEDRDARTAAYVAERAERAERADQGSGDALDTFVDGVRHNAEEPHLVELMTVLSAEAISADHPAHDWFVRRYDNLVTRLAADIEREQRSGLWQTGLPAEAAARILVGLADGLRLQRLLGQPDLDHAELLAETLRWLRTGTPPAGSAPAPRP